MEIVINKLVSDRPVVVFSKNSCCMSHTIKKLLSDCGVNSTVYELDELSSGKEIEQALVRIIGGELVRSADE